MQRVCDIITNCCCETTDKITEQLNKEIETRVRNQILQQCSNNLENTQNNIPSYVQSNLTHPNSSDTGEHTTPTGYFSMRNVFTPKSQEHKDGYTGTYAKYDINNQNRQQDQPPMMAGNETNDLQSQDYLNIAGYQNYRQVPPAHEMINVRPPMADKQHYNVQQHPTYNEYKNANKVTRSRFNPFNMCCSCCCDVGELQQIQRNIIDDNNRAIILKPIRRERIVEVMVEEIHERVINIPQIQYVDKFVEVPKPIFQYKIREVKRPVIVEKIVKVDKIVEEDKIIEVPEIQYVDKEVDVPQIVKKERIVEVPLPIVRERRIPILKLRKNEIFQEIDNVNYNEFGINLTSLRGDGIDAPIAPNNTPIKGNVAENDTNVEKSGEMQVPSDNTTYETVNNKPEEKSTKSETFAELEQPQTYNVTDSFAHPPVNQPVQAEMVNQSTTQSQKGEIPYEQSVAETSLIIYGASNKAAGKHDTEESQALDSSSLTIMEIFTGREEQDENEMYGGAAYSDYANQVNVSHPTMDI
ncbi:hypothetical protein X943_003261 [Babesia divergens]|uniref:Uncharacterized protein n=1 Tax=Babesia divergens TaxID=32595 RepID=A0AAD9GKZ0_BABDI|nr:hypothetical protein X943_003261 [Babesia divergens]